MNSCINQDLYPGEFALHKKYAQSPMLLDLVWTHCNIVADIALDLVDQAKFDVSETPRDIAVQAALLHDIGVYLCGGFEWLPGQPQSDKPYIQHTVVGAWILQQEGYSAPVVQAAYVHTGVGLTPEDIQMYGLQLPSEDYMPRTTLQKLITYAAKFHSKAPKFRSPEDITTSLSKYGQDKVDRFNEFQELFGLPNMEQIENRYDNWHRGFNFEISKLSQPSTSPLNLAGLPN
jgi:uncharacterized protein